MNENRLIGKLLKHKLVIGILGICLVIIVFYCLGFRITYNPQIVNDWVAIGAMGQWGTVCATIAVVFLSAHLTQRFNDRTKEITLSNAARVEIVKEIEMRIEDKLKKLDGIYKENEPNHEMLRNYKQEILKYIELCTVTTTDRISKFIGIDVEKTYEYLNEMETDKIVTHMGDNSNLDLSKLLWKKNR